MITVWTKNEQIDFNADTWKRYDNELHILAGTKVIASFFDADGVWQKDDFASKSHA